MNVQQDITVLKEHPPHITNLAVQAPTTPSNKETLHWIVYHVIQVVTVLVLEMTSQQTVVVLGFIVPEGMKKLNLAQHAVRQVTTVNKDHTIWQSAHLDITVMLTNFTCRWESATQAITAHLDLVLEDRLNAKKVTIAR